MAKNNTMSDFKSRVSSRSIYAYVLCLVTLALLVCECSAYGAFWNAIHASVRNDISDKTVLTIHCKSKDDDLGEHKLAYGQSFNWTFHQNFMRSTMFWCFMWWTDSTGKTIQGSYEVVVEVDDDSYLRIDTSLQYANDLIFGSQAEAKEWLMNKEK
ncbi:S-protein homolog 29-like [Papaver somniferum]|uniref:S-protein homolog 29-like n=1 Tax=Papaver somniferum TaxID=3469 RepID=UPI000E6FBB2C|nr:S-protein homolog 29-like [Papaver somniferum]